jgi:hypothetical protein
VSEQDKQANKVYPYGYVVHPQHVLDYCKTGESFDWLLICETYREDDSFEVVRAVSDTLPYINKMNKALRKELKINL